MPSIAGRVLRADLSDPATLGAIVLFQCPPSRAGSCGQVKKLKGDTPEFQCPPSRAGSCGATSRVR